MMASKVWIASNRPFPERVARNPQDLVRLLESYYPETPQTIYFPFWSWKVPKEITDRINCIGFHAAPLPKGKGGSPIQNMICLGYKKTELCMFRMNTKFDGGDIIKRTDVSLRGSLTEIVERMRWVITNMINNKDSYNAKPSDNFKEVPDSFERITGNHLPEWDELSKVYDEIRMRDEENHPKAFIYHGRHVIEFTNAKIKEGEIKANVRITQG